MAPGTLAGQGGVQRGAAGMSDTVSTFDPDHVALSPRVPPHSIEAEQSVLGGLMLAEDAWDRVADRVTEADFYRREHRLLFRAIGELADREQPRDVVTVSEWLSQRPARPTSSPMPTSSANARCCGS